MQGVVYIISNRSMPGLLKVGYTTRTLSERLDELSSTGVPKGFQVEFFCKVDSADRLESRTHRILQPFHYGKEFFKCSVYEAVKAVKTELLSGQFVISDIGGQSHHAFLTDAEKNEIERQRINKEWEEKQRIELNRLVAGLEKNFIVQAAVAEAAIKKYCSLGKYEGLKTIAMFALVPTVIGILLFDKISPCPFDDGENTARKMTSEEKQALVELYHTISLLRSYSAWHRVAEKYYRNNIKEQNLTGYENSRGTFDVSDMLRGVFLGLGLVKAN